MIYKLFYRHVYIQDNKYKERQNIYIGQTIGSIEKRFSRHINDSYTKNFHISRVIRKYGKDAFIIEQIDTAESQEELTQKEHDWIIKLNSTDPKIGYNETSAMHRCGGNTYASKTKEEMLEISKKISESKTGKLNPNSRMIKCENKKTNEILIFDTVKECQEYFNMQARTFIYNRCKNIAKSLFRDEWDISYY